MSDPEHPNTNGPSMPPHERPSTPNTPLAAAMVHEHQSMVTKGGIPIDPPDKGSSLSRSITLIFAILIASLTIFWQNSSEDMQRTLLRSPPPPPPVELTENDPAPGEFGFADIYARMFLKMSKFYSTQPSSAETLLTSLDSVLLSTEDQIRGVVVSAELVGVEEAQRRLNSIEAELMISDTDLTIDESHPLIVRDLRILRAIYDDGQSAIHEDDRAYITTRYSTVGETALTYGLDDDDPQRKPLITGMVLPLVVFSLFLISVILIGFAMLIVGVVLVAMGKLKHAAHQPTPGGSVFLETYAVFVGAFFVYALFAGFLEHRPQYHQFLVFTLPAQWALLTFAFWGILRGMNPTRWRHAIGLYRGQGIFREIGCGLLAYLASIPLFLLGTLVTMVLLVIQEWILAGGAGADSENIQLPANPIFEMVAKGDVFLIVMLFTLATLWAPLCEELVFRGALFRHLRGRVHWVFAALISAVLFAFMHSYGPLMLTPLIVLGFMFAFMRQWRGSLIAPMTAHFLHNFSIMVITVMIVRSLV